MKRGTLLFLLLSLAMAAPLLDERQGHGTRNIPNYPGIRFGSDGKLSITVFSDLHFGERESLNLSHWGNSLADNYSFGCAERLEERRGHELSS